jgi:hypothetical protein
MALASQNNDWATVRAHQAAIDALDRQNQQNTFVGGQNDLTRKNALTIAGMPARSQLGPGGGGAGGISPDVINNIAEGIVSGKQPPVLTGLYRMAGPVRSALQERGFDLSSAQQDWSASQRWINTVNSTQYKGLRDSIQFTQNSIPMVRDLVTQWDSAGLPLLSAANLALAKSGAKGQDAQELARKLDGAMGEMQANLATIYRSGYSPTNTALESAAKSLSGDWSRKAALGSLDQIERIVSYRDQAMQQVGPMTGRDENQYAPRGNAPPPDTGGASGNLPPVTSSWTIDANGNPVKKAPGASSSGGAKYDEFGNPIR